MNNLDQLTKFIVTGTKGKTTICNLINHFLVSTGKTSLLVDSLGSFLNNKQQTTFEDSIKNIGKSPNVMPGRYIYWELVSGQLTGNDYAVLEASLACFNWGTGIDAHDIGIFTNVFRDHLDFKILKDEMDIYHKKSFVYTKLKPGGKFIASLDNEYSLKSFSEPELLEKKATLIGVSSKCNLSELEKIKEEVKLNDILFIKEDRIWSLNEGELFDLKYYPYYLDGRMETMSINLLFAFAATQTLLSRDEMARAASNYMLPETYGRLLFYQKGDQHIMIDYAHEPFSLHKLADFAQDYFKEKPLIVTRIAPDRNDEAISDFAKSFARIESISELIIYDKIDGTGKKTYEGRKIRREAGESSQKLFDQLEKLPKKFKVTRIVNEEEALQAALASGNKVVLHIFSDLSLVLKLIKSKGYERKL